VRVYISANMEGVTGVAHPEEVITGRSQYERFRHLLTGDDPTYEEAEPLYAGVKMARVKTAVDRYTARCLRPETAHRRIREAAAGAVRGPADLAPYEPEGSYTFAVVFAAASTAAGVLHFPQLVRLDDRRVSWSHEDYATTYRMFVGVTCMARSDPDYG
jgi:D-amino peptidase